MRRCGYQYNDKGAREAADLGAATYVGTRPGSFGALAIAVLLCVGAGWLIVHGVSRPIAAMTRVMRRLAGRDMAVEIAGLGRKDEIGAMAEAVQVFKDNMIAADRLAAEQAAQGAAKVAHARSIETLTQSFEAKIGELVGAVASAATEMEATAQSMVSTAEQTNQQSVAVAAASEADLGERADRGDGNRGAGGVGAGDWAAGGAVDAGCRQGGGGSEAHRRDCADARGGGAEDR